MHEFIYAIKKSFFKIKTRTQWFVLLLLSYIACNALASLSQMLALAIILCSVGVTVFQYRSLSFFPFTYALQIFDLIHSVFRLSYAFFFSLANVSCVWNFLSYRIHSNRAPCKKYKWFYEFFRHYYSRNRLINCTEGIMRNVWVIYDLIFHQVYYIQKYECWILFTESALLTIPSYRPMKWLIDRDGQLGNRRGDQIRVWLLVKDFLFVRNVFRLPVNIGFMRYFSNEFIACKDQKSHSLKLI